MRLAIFGLSVTSSWGNGHATLWRGLIRALAARGWEVVFFERNVPYYRSTRDRDWIEGGRLVLYDEWQDVASEAGTTVLAADVALVTSYCPDALPATALVCNGPRALSVFYDLDTPVTLANFSRGGRVDYIGPEGLSRFDLVLSYTGGAALDDLSRVFGARATAPLYGHVDPGVHRPGSPRTEFAADLSYIGTYAADRQAAVEELLVTPARRRPEGRFVIAGAQYPEAFPWTENINFVRHLPPDDHPDFYASSRLTLNVTREAMARCGWCPSGRLFEAAACGAAIISDAWPGIGDFFTPGEEIVVVSRAEEVDAALDLPDEQLQAIAANGRARALRDHSSARRAEEFEAIVSAARAEPAMSLEGA